MFKRKTVFIVGAGASAEAKLPLGPALADEIAGTVRLSRNELTGRLDEHNPFVREVMNHAVNISSAPLL